MSRTENHCAGGLCPPATVQLTAAQRTIRAMDTSWIRRLKSVLYFPAYHFAAHLHNHDYGTPNRRVHRDMVIVHVRHWIMSAANLLLHQRTSHMEGR